MEGKSKNKKKALIMIGAVIAALAGVLIIATIVVAVLIPYMQYKSYSFKPDTVLRLNRKYATDYALEVDETRNRVCDKWNIRKRENDGEVFLSIWSPGQKEDIRQYLTFAVFDTDEEAQDAYDQQYSEYRQYIQEEEDKWFTAWRPDVCDAEIVSMFYLEDNVIITCDISVTGTMFCYSDEITPTPTPAPTPAFTRASLKAYTIENASELKDYVLNTILTEDPGLTEEEVRARMIDTSLHGGPH